MPYIQENKVQGYWNGKKTGRKSHPRFSITIPMEIIKAMKWKKGDEVEFMLKDGKFF